LWRRENDTFMCEHFAHVLSFNFNKSKSLIASNGHIFLPHRWGTYLLPHPIIHRLKYTNRREQHLSYWQKKYFQMKIYLQKKKTFYLKNIFIFLTIS
jgi:hypothetical protein